MIALLVALGGLAVVLACTAIGVGLGRLIDPFFDRLESSIEWKDHE